MQFISFRVILKRIKAVPFFLKDKTVPLRKKNSGSFWYRVFIPAYRSDTADFIPIRIYR